MGIKRPLKYETYDPAVEGYGNPDQWRQIFSRVMNGQSSIEQARQILGVTPNATSKEIQRAYWNLAKQHRADGLNAADHSAFDKITDAYKVVRESLTYSTPSPTIIIPTQQTVQPQYSSIFLPQLLNEISEEDLERYFTDSRFCAQEKHDGRRRMLRHLNGKTGAYNKKGELRDCLADFQIDCDQIGNTTRHHEFLLDGEEVEDILFVFDILSLDEIDLRVKTYSERWLQNFLIGTRHIKPVYTAFTEKEKRDLFEYLKINKKEGIVFKLLSGIHLAGYSDDQVKFKFWATGSVIVIRHNVQNSIGIGVVEHGQIVPIGNVTMIGHDKPPVGTVVEVKYLYANRGGCLYQPSFIGPRDDTDVADCKIEKIKFKN
jgi:ATP-dependent DNA ligase